MGHKTKILLFDIETAPNLSWVWGKYEQNVIAYQQEWYMMTFAYKWLGQKQIKAKALPDFKTYKKDHTNDRELVAELWSLLDEADIVIAHNGDQFDIKKANARFLYHGLPAPSPYKTVDTKKVLKRYFKLNSNSLNDASELLGLGEKVDTGGFDLWLGCMAGKATAWRDMVKYNKQDVHLLEKLYLATRGWIHNHHNVNLVDEAQGKCPNCGSHKLQKRGWGYTKVSKYQRYQCTDCGAWSRGRQIYKTEIDITT